MIELVLAADDSAGIRAELIGGETEKCAILYANQTARADGTVRLLAREINHPADADYARRGLLEAELKPEFVARVTKKARSEQGAIVFVHSHPGLKAPDFSPIDSEGEKHLAAFLSHRHPALVHAALVVSAGGMRARRIGSDEAIRIISIGTNRQVIFDPTTGSHSISEVFDRQVRALGSEGQAALQRLRIAIVGLGGTGSIVAQQITHLGVRDFILVDPDILEHSNLNRLASAVPADVGQPKVEIAARAIRAFAKDASVVTIQGDVIQAHTARQLLNADVIFGCTDSHGSRAVLQQVSYQYMIPCIDMGVVIAVAERRITHVFGRVQMLAPGLACLTCSNLLDPNEVRRDMMTAFERQADPYIQGEREPAPAVMSLNGTVASLAVTMLISGITELPIPARHLLYNGLSSSLRSVRAHPKENCFICSRSGALARGDSWPLFAREDTDAH
jgi:molybdopterin/thiamine biosynthesis adenylyltransferase